MGVRLSLIGKLAQGACLMNSHPGSQLSRKSGLVILSPSAELALSSHMLLLMHWLHSGRLEIPILQPSGT